MATKPPAPPQKVFEGIRDFIIQSAELKFNCFFLMPLVDAFPQRLREELEGAWEVGRGRGDEIRLDRVGWGRVG
jgi:hypothetical protein